MSARRRWLPRLVAVGLLCATVALTWSGCGSRSGLKIHARVQDAATETAALPEVCERADYRTGHELLSIYVLLDKSGSMLDDSKWSQATAALTAFVNDPETEGVALGISYFPRSSVCNPKLYETPDVAIAPLPGNAAKVTASLAKQKPDGETPTLLALRGAIEYSRALATANPAYASVIALITDGDPNACGSSVHSVAAAAEDGANGAPQVLTFAIGLAQGFLGDLALIASKGGTGKPILVGKGDNPAAELVSALRALRDTQKTCRYAIPNASGAVVGAGDLHAAYRLDAASPLTLLPRLASATACGGGPGFIVDDPVEPGFVELCPASCLLLRDNPGSLLTVVNGCDGTFDGGVPTPAPDAGGCGGVVSFSCVESCGSTKLSLPICVGGTWQCPVGTLPKPQCDQCPPIPHACCTEGGGLEEAICLDGAWTCAPGATLWGSPGCQSPEICASKLPCPFGMYCVAPDAFCGDGLFAGKCQPVPITCAEGGPPVCGCDGSTYASACAAAKAGVAPGVAKICPAPGGHFACGPLFCALGSGVCRRTTTLVSPPVPDLYACQPLSPGCGSPCGCAASCDCPPGKLCGQSCNADPETGAPLLLCTVS